LQKAAWRRRPQNARSLRNAVFSRASHASISDLLPAKGLKNALFYRVRKSMAVLPKWGRCAQLQILWTRTYVRSLWKRLTRGAGDWRSVAPSVPFSAQKRSRSVPAPP
jgi:hypothetical protein